MSMVQQLVAMYGRPLPLPMLEFMRQNFEDGRGDNTPLRLGKRSFYEGGVRVPALVSWPGVIQAEVESQQMITVQDVLPTMLEAAELEVGARRSHSTDLLNGRQFRVRKEQPRADYLAEALEGIALYRYPWKLLSFKNGNHELYNVAADPLESKRPGRSGSAACWRDAGDY
jgi:arylsulfatase A-like enzyme